MQVNKVSCEYIDFIGLHFAVIANVRTVKKARKDMEKAFLTALRAGFAIGFSIVSLSVLVLTLIISSYMASYITEQSTAKDYSDLFMYITGYALGASVVALFGRVGGGIFTKAADVGVDLTTTKEPEDVEKNPGIVADFVGDNVGDVVGTGSDLFASFAESDGVVVFGATALECTRSNLFPDIGVHFGDLGLNPYGGYYFASDPRWQL